MSRRPRVLIEGAVYHVYNRTVQSLQVFETDDDAALFLELLRQLAARDGWTIFAFCLLPSHFHIVLRSGAPPIARGMGRLQAQFSQRWNRSKRSRGPVWQGRYKAKMVEDEGYLYQLIAYVHLNPVVAGFVEDPAQWRRSGHLDLIGKRKDPIVAVGAVLPLYGNRLSAAQRAYVESLRLERGGPWQGEQPGRLPWWPTTPDRPIEMPVPPAVADDRGVSTGLYRPQLKPEVFFELACTAMGVEDSDLETASRSRELSRQRQLIVGLGVERWFQGTKSLANLMNRKADTGTAWVRRCIERRTTDSVFDGSYNVLDEAVSVLSRTVEPE
jgi:REP element-mobilizing transposase RayT